MMRKRIHYLLGILFFIAFIGGGKWMKVVFPDGAFESDLIRMMYRANHLYILFISLMHFLAGSISIPPKSVKQFVASLGSVLLLTSGIFLVIAFIHEPPSGLWERPLTFYGAVTAISGTLLTVIPSTLLHKKRTSTSHSQ